ncbi:MAG: hypothetical protein ACE5E9_03285 [Nitrospinaceae bacterium]
MTRLLVLFIAVLIFPGAAFSGTIQGTTVYSAKIKLPPVFKTGKYKKACGPEIRNEKILVENKGLKNVVITIEGEDLPEKRGKYTLDQTQCHYEPHVIAVPKDSELVIRSSDPINHNLHSYSFDNDPINIMFTPGQEDYTQELEEPEIIKIECDLHSWMTAWIVVTENSLFAISDKKGSFEIPNVPPGKYTLTAWHEVLGSLNQTVTVGDGVTKVNFDFSNISPQVSKK